MNWYKKARALSASEALFGFMAWLTTRDKESGPYGASNATCGEAAELISEFCDVNKLKEPVDGWEEYLTHPKTAGSLSQTISGMPMSTRMHVAPFLRSMGFSDDGKPLKEKPLTKKEKKERQEAHARWREEEYEHMPA